MGLASVLTTLATKAPVPVFGIAGSGARDALQNLGLEPALRFTVTPRAANVLLVAGPLRPHLMDAAVAVHDAMTRPRATVLWTLGGDAEEVVARLPQAVVVEDGPVAAIVRVHKELLRGERRSEPALLPDIDPAPWRGVGPYGHGGSGMTGGVPYGRPLADRADDRDGLKLDQLPLRVGPFFPPLPPGLALDVRLQGDVIQSVAIPKRVPEPRSRLDTPAQGVFGRALMEPVPIAALELARAQSHLRWLAHALGVAGLEALGMRALRTARAIAAGGADATRALARLLRRSGVLGWATTGVGVIPSEVVARAGAGPVGRAAGLAEDARSDDPAYAALGFEPLVQEGSDVAARWRQRLDEAIQALELAGRAGARLTGRTDAVESPRGRLDSGSSPTERLLPLVPAALAGLEWGDAVATVVSLDLDLDELRAPGRAELAEAAS